MYISKFCFKLRLKQNGAFFNNNVMFHNVLYIPRMVTKPNLNFKLVVLLGSNPAYGTYIFLL